METVTPQPPQKKNLLQLLSIKTLQQEIINVAQRFTFTIVFIAFLTLFGWVCIWTDNLNDDFVQAMWVGLSIGALLSLAAYLWCEYLQAERRSLACQLGVLVVATLNFLYIYVKGPYLTMADGVGYGAVYTAAIVAIFFVPVVRRSSIKLQWNYSCRVLGAVALGVLLFLVMGIFVSILYGTLNLLFSFSSYKLLVSCNVLFAATIPAIVSLCCFPSLKRLKEEELDSSKPHMAIFCKNVLLPLALVYTLILYVYGLKILFTWDLPNGNVCWMVIGLVTVNLIIVYGLQGFVCNASTKASSKKIAELSVKYIPVLMLPLLVLMSVAIFYRIGEYGITASRLYVATFNIWAYGMAIYMIASRMPRLNLVASSFAVLFVATSIIPGANYCTIGINTVRNAVKERLSAVGVKNFPVAYNDMIELLKGQDKETIEAIASDLDYLDNWNDHRAVADIVTSSTKINKWEITNLYPNSKENSLRVDGNYDNVVIPQGYRNVEYVKIRGNGREWNNENSRLNFKDSLTITLPMDSLMHIDADADFKPVICNIDDNDDRLLILTDIDVSDYNDYYITITGYLFSK